MPKETEPQSLEKINEDYRGQWVIVTVTACTQGAPSEGILLAHGSRSKIDKLLATLPRAEPGRPYYVFLAMKPIRTAEEWRAVLERAAEQELPFAW